MGFNKASDVRSFWEKRASLGENAGSDDFILKKIEIKSILSCIDKPSKILEIGCGTGRMAIEMARQDTHQITAIDYSQAMISNAEELLAKERELKGHIEFMVGDIRNLVEIKDRYDIVVTERVLINLESWAEQECAIRGIIDLLNPGGLYLMCENSLQGLKKINDLRKSCGLPEIQYPWHNTYFDEKCISSLSIRDVELVGMRHISSMYYFISRVVNAWLAKKEEQEPKYDALINELGYVLPEYFDLGQTKLWIFKKNK